jgi:hypothetical protein
MTTTKTPETDATNQVDIVSAAPTSTSTMKVPEPDTTNQVGIASAGPASTTTMEAVETDSTNQVAVVSTAPTPQKAANASKTIKSKEGNAGEKVETVTVAPVDDNKTGNTVIQGEFIISIIMFCLLHF